MRKLTYLLLFITIILLISCTQQQNTDDTDNDLNSQNSIKIDNSLVSSQNSNESPKQPTNSELIKQAEVLSEHIIKYSVSSQRIFENNTLIKDLNIRELTEYELFNFISTLFIYSENENHPYSHITIFSNDESDGTIFYDIYDTKTMVDSFFGVEDYVYSDNSYIDSEKNLYFIEREKGYGNNLTIGEIRAVIESERLICDVEILSGSIGEHGDNPYSYGYLTAIFEKNSDGCLYFVGLFNTKDHIVSTDSQNTQIEETQEKAIGAVFFTPSENGDITIYSSNDIDSEILFEFNNFSDSVSLVCYKLEEEWALIKHDEYFGYIRYDKNKDTFVEYANDYITLEQAQTSAIKHLENEWFYENNFPKITFTQSEVNFMLGGHPVWEIDFYADDGSAGTISIDAYSNELRAFDVSLGEFVINKNSASLYQNRDAESKILIMLEKDTTYRYSFVRRDENDIYWVSVKNPGDLNLYGWVLLEDVEFVSGINHTERYKVSIN